MALSQRHRQSLYVELAPTIGEEEAEALLSQFPSLQSEEPVTDDRLDAAIAGVRADFAGLRSELSDLKSDFSDLRADFADLRADVARMEATLTERMRQQALWTFGALVSGLTLGMGLAAAVTQAMS